MENKTVVLYHNNCNDGFTAAWLSSLVLPANTEYIPVNYGEQPPDVKGKNVYILDFSYKKDVLLNLADKNDFVTILDHHATAEKELEGLNHPRMQCVFDMNESGATLAFNHFGEQICSKMHYIAVGAIQKLALYIKDRDLWKFELPDSRAINAWLQTQDRTFDIWGRFPEFLYSDFFRNNIIKKGQGIIDYQEAAVKSMAKKAKIVEFEGRQVPVLNATGLISELGNHLCETCSMSMSYFIDSNGKFIFSLRSKKDSSVDCSEIARLYGGGGHKNAAGFQLTIEEVVLKRIPIFEYPVKF